MGCCHSESTHSHSRGGSKNSCLCFSERAVSEASSSSKEPLHSSPSDSDTSSQQAQMASVSHGCHLHPVHLADVHTGGSPCGWPSMSQMTTVSPGDILGEGSPITTPIPKPERHLGPRATLFQASSGRNKVPPLFFLNNPYVREVLGGSFCPPIPALPSLPLPTGVLAGKAS